MASTVQETEITNIHEELRKMWDAAQGEKKTRASLFNLVLYVPKGERIELFDTIVNSVVNKFPCRVLLIVCDEKSKEDVLNSTVSSHTIGEGNLSIYCEIVRIEVSGKYVQRVPFLVIPNIQADLPVYLMWTQDPLSENSIFPKLARIAHRIIFDSESTANLQKYSQKVLEIENSYHAEVGDLNWSALAGWRKILAESYNEPEMLNHLRHCSEIKITYNKSESVLHPHTEIEAAYLQAWIASRLDWKLRSFLTYTNGKEKVKVTIEGVKTDLPAGAIVSLELTSKNTGGHFRFRREPNSQKVMGQFSDNEKCDLPVCNFLTGVTEGKEIINEIFYPSSREHFCSALNLLSITKWK
ncbi:MAG: glucose-6-phosphate dehydrogenase assembly protein OpcA [Chlamydiales bacterium]|nr:glucose-6-phosphate dehydrogenase assembly protein OpcA [Chlamydiales bacterium]